MARFNNDRGEAVCGAKTSSMSKKDRKEQLLNQHKHVTSRLKKFKRDMKALKQLDGDYEYSSEHLATMVGRCYMNMDMLKGERQSIAKQLKEL